MEKREDETTKVYAKNVHIVIKIVYIHTKTTLFVFHADIML